MTKILVIHNEEPLLNEVASWLNSEGYETSEAKDGITGIKITLRTSPDIIVCDIAMPSLDGYQVVLELAAHPATAQIPFIFVTANATHEDIRRGKALVADDYITKPFTRLQLLQAVQARLEEAAVQTQRYQREVEQLQRVFEIELEQRMAKAKMVAIFSHDFRNLLSVIMTTNGLLRRFGNRLEEERRQAHLLRIDAAASQLLQMLDDTLVIAQIETDKLDFTPRWLPITDFLGEIVEEFQVMNGETHRLLFASHLTEPVLADPRLLRQIATNLISNAIKYSPQGGEVQVTLDQHTEQEFVLVVRDQGIGIPEADQAHLFTAFVRGSNTTNIPGTGLGLVIVKQAVDLHGGSIHFESQSGVGTTITVVIPNGTALIPSSPTSR